MKINVTNELFALENGRYTGTITSVYPLNKECMMIKIALESGDTFVTFRETRIFGEYPFSVLFKALDTDDTDTLVGQKVNFEIKNNKSKNTGKIFSNIRKISIAV